ncbi:hypothetical protein F5Y17DRAFT_477232 [Xylariaceae sp. FL0594]|nr:hypothetical protein F5Y17DRAFT_477232 [Xylariaceae sp. FL0594]
MDTDPAAAKAAAAAFRQFVTEDFTLFGVGLLVTVTRTYARIRQVGLKGLQADDYLAWVAMLIYSAETALAYSVGAKAMGLANNGMTDEQRLSLSPNDPEYHTRVTGCKIQLAGWSTYSALLWTLKASLLVFYIRLTNGLGRGYLRRIYIGFGLLGVTYLAATLNLFLGCRPFRRYWQIYPDPGNTCQPAISTRIVWVYASLNIISDIYLLSIPIPMLWSASMKLPKKIGLIALFSGGVFVIVCALIRAVLIITDPVAGAQTAGSWAVRETFVAVLTANLPMVFPLVSALLRPVISSARSAYYPHHASPKNNESDKRKLKSFVTIGGTGEKRKLGRGGRSGTGMTTTGLTFTESEERILCQGQGQGHGHGEAHHIKLQDLGTGSMENNHENKNNNTTFTTTTSTSTSEEEREGGGERGGNIHINTTTVDGITISRDISVSSAPNPTPEHHGQEDDNTRGHFAFAFATNPVTRKDSGSRLPR